MEEIASFRKGNFAYLKGYNKFVHVNWIDGDSAKVEPVTEVFTLFKYQVNKKGVETICLIEDLEGIQITRDLLSHFGFTKNGPFPDSYMTQNRKGEHFLVVIVKDENGIVTLKDQRESTLMNYFHELQNSIMNSEGDILDDIE